MNFEPDIEQSLKVLRAGGLILYPTDTIWGIGCDATNEDAVEKVYSLKKRPDNKSLIILLADERDLLSYVSAPDLEVFSYLKNVQKPTTVIYDGAISLADNVINEDGSIGIRIVKDSFCKHLIKRFDIASLSFGAERKFLFRHKQDKQTVSVFLENGSLLLMYGTTQTYWLHRMPPTKKVSTPRINLTFRTIIK